MTGTLSRDASEPDQGSSLRTLVVGERFPWPEDHGAAMRLANVVRGFARLGQVELFSLIHPGGERACVLPPGAPVARLGLAGRPEVGLSRRLRLSWLAGGRLPLELFGRDYSSVRSAFRTWERGPYDLAWFGDAEAFVALGSLVGAPSIVDFDDLEDQTAWLKGPESESTASGARRFVNRVGGGLGDVERRLRHDKNGRRWRALQERASRSVAALAVCSELDRSRLGLPGTVVVPNGYCAPTVPLGRIAVGSPPTILLPGYLRYGPNIDAAQRLVSDIGTLIWSRAPEVRIRLVGLGDVRARRLHRPPSVVVTGRVEDMSTELRRADILAVPLCHAGGTRIKILEAFAHRIPVVSTPIGAEGLDVRDGEHLILRSEPEDFADACLSLLEDEGLRASLADKAATLFHERYRWDTIQRHVAEAGLGVVRASASCAPGCGSDQQS